MTPAITDSRYYGLSLLRKYGHFRGTKNDNFIVLPLDKTSTTKYFSHFAVHHLSTHTSKDLLIFTSIL